jgi:hypothetical protein
LRSKGYVISFPVPELSFQLNAWVGFVFTGYDLLPSLLWIVLIRREPVPVVIAL